MNADLITLLSSFLEGFALIISPCVLSILPLILAGAMVGTKNRSLGIIIGFVITFSLFAFFARQLVHYSGIDLNLLRYIAYGLLLLFSIILLSEDLSNVFNRLTQRMSNIGVHFAGSSMQKTGFINGLVIGALIALIWTPCAGPILAAVIVQIVIQQAGILSFFTLFAFALGAAIPMFIITLYGLKIRDSFAFFKTHAALFRKLLGVIIILNVIYMIALESGLFPSSVTNQTGIRTANYLRDGLWKPYKAPEIEGIDQWINSAPLQPSDLKNKVVLVDFWTYSCINCVRTIPYLNEWYKNYHDKGLVIIGVHTPEFDFEKNVANISKAVKNYGIQYPVAVDSQFVTWQNFSNRFWPAHYLINKKGQVVYQHFGEGQYDVTENNIRFLLGMNEPVMPMKSDNSLSDYFITPETYLGFARADSSLSPELIQDDTAHYSFSNDLKVNAWALQGAWRVYSDKIEAMSKNAAVKIHFNAKKVFVVMGNKSDKPISVNVLLNGKPVVMNKGQSLSNGQIQVDHYALYEVLDFPVKTDGILELSSEIPGLEVFTFTFGG